MEILGRTDSMIKVKGVNVFPSQIEEVILKNENVTSNYEIIISTADHKDGILIKIEKNHFHYLFELYYHYIQYI